MAAVNEIIEALEGINVREITEHAIVATKEEFAKLNTDQMFEGKLNDGSDIKPDYSPRTAKRKGKTTPDLRNSGDFHSEYELKVEGDSLSMNSDVEYTKYIEKRYTGKIWDLEEQRNDQYMENHFEPAFKERLEQLTNLPFNGV